MTEQVVLVDKNDVVIGSAKRSEVRPSGCFYRVSALWLTNSQGYVLLAQRAFTKKNDPGKWGPAVAGTVEVGETYYENIVKETEEELGRTDIEFREGPKVRRPNYFVQWYFGHIDISAEEFIIQEEEVEQVKWVNLKEEYKHWKVHPENYVPNFGKYLELFNK